MRNTFFLSGSKWACLLGSVMLFSNILSAQKLFFSGEITNDLYRQLVTEKISFIHCNSLDQALNMAQTGDGILQTATGYPYRQTPITPAQYQICTDKKIRMYIEYPASIPGTTMLPPVEATLERGVVTSSFFGSRLPSMSILGVNGCFYIPVQSEKSLLSLAKVAGFDKAQFGLTDTRAFALLVMQDNILIATSRLSDSRQGRFGPSDSWKIVWEEILQWVSGKSLRLKHWQSDPHPSYAPTGALPPAAVSQAISRSADWLWKARLFIHPSWEKEQFEKYQPKNGDPNLFFGPPIGNDLLIGDGSRGIMEGHASKISWDGTQQYRYFVRADVQGESAFLLAAAAKDRPNEKFTSTAEHLLDYLFYTSGFRGGARNNPDSACFGLISWANTHPGTFFNDDNARCILGTIGASTLLQNHRWDQFIVENILANLRTSSKQGFQGNALTQEQIQSKGWQYYNNRDFVNLHPHFESWMWACYLWLYDKTHYAPLLDKARTGIELMMAAYPDKWLSQNGIQQERARMILPLAWLVRVEDTPQHRSWLDQVVKTLLQYQQPCGAIREELGNSRSDQNKILVTSNQDYGKNEASLIAVNGDPVADMLYTCNFSFFALNEAAEATGNPAYRRAVAKLSDFLVRIQTQSTTHPDVDGTWFRAFDYKRWDYWASNADNGWGAWATLTGWIQSWITTTLALTKNHQSYWDITRKYDMTKPMQNAIWMMDEHTPPTISLTLIPPSVVTTKVPIDIRAGIVNRQDHDQHLLISLYLDTILPTSLLHQQKATLSPDSSICVKWSMPAGGKSGQHTIQLVVQDDSKVYATSRTIRIVESSTRSTQQLGGAWAGIYHWSETEGKHWNPAIAHMTDRQWSEMVNSMHKLDMDILVIQESFRHQAYVGQHRMTPETYPGKAFYPSQLYSGRMPVAAHDPVEAMLLAADTAQMNVFVGVGLFAWFDFSEASLQWHQQVAKELWNRYGHHPSFYGFYISEESVGSLDNQEPTDSGRQLRRQEIVSFFKNLSGFCNRFAPGKPLMLATNSMQIPGAESTYRQLLPYVDILCPFGFSRMPPGDLTGLQAAGRLQTLCDQSGSHLWFDLEAFLFYPDQSLYPRPIEGIVADLQKYTGFEKVICYQYPGVFSDPLSSRRIGLPATVDLFRQYQQYLQKSKTSTH